MTDEDIPTYGVHYPDGAKFFTIGGSGLLYTMPVPSTNPRTIINHKIERRIYNRLGSHPNIIKCLRMDECGIYLERAEHDCIRKYFRDGGTATIQERIKWSRDVANALQYVHEHNIRHADLSGRNVLLDPSRNVRLCDFAGSAIDDESATVGAESGFRHPDDKEANHSTICAELHALGSTIYELCTSLQPHGREIDESIVGQWIREGKYPSVKEVAQSIEQKFENTLK